MNAYKRYEDTQTKRAQVVFLTYVKEETADFIAELTGYAKSTVKQYAKKFVDLLEVAKEMFKHSRKTADQKHTMPTENTVIQTTKGEIEFHADSNYPAGTQIFYLIRAFDSTGKRLFSKVGTTSRTVKQRMTEHLRDYKKLGVVKIVVDKIWNCGCLPAEGFESWFRAVYISKFTEAFKKNDRFFGIDFDLEEAEKIYTNYTQMSV